jgi:NAD(P)-dependent dehydrogenase (short-subunit alcohol dehydrogenase family)
MRAVNAECAKSHVAEKGMYREKYDLTGSTALITGGARGIGLASAEALAEHGASIVICDINRETLEEGRARLAKSGYDVRSVLLDVTNPGEVRRVADSLNTDGQIDILIANAGTAWPDTAAEEMTDEVWLRVIDINLNGVFWCCREFGKHMVKRKRGSIVTLGSMSGIISNKPQRQSHYNASKAAVHHLTKSLAGEWAPSGVRVNSVAPTYIDTPMSRGGMENKEWFPTWMEFTPMNRVGRADEIASVVLFLASEASSVMTGSVVVADAGYTVW